MKKILFVFLGLIMLGLGTFAFVEFVKVQNITCESQYGTCEDSIKNYVLSSQGKNILDARKTLVDNLSKDKTVLQYQVQFELPNNFRVDVIEKKALAAFTLKDGNFALVDSEGEVVQKVKDTSLPKLTSIDLTHDQIVFIANLISRLYSFYGVNAGKVTNDGLEVDGIYGKKVLFPLSGDQDELLGSLVLILSRLPSVTEATTISTIDLRFKNPVLR